MPLRCTYLLRSKSDGQIADRKSAHTDAAVPCTSPEADPKAVRRKVTVVESMIWFCVDGTEQRMAG